MDLKILSQRVTFLFEDFEAFLLRSFAMTDSTQNYPSIIAVDLSVVLFSMEGFKFAVSLLFHYLLTAMFHVGSSSQVLV
jgi:hypothetical protein